MEIRGPRAADAKKGLEYINSLVEEGAMIGVIDRSTLAQEKRIFKEMAAGNRLKKRIDLFAFDDKKIAGTVKLELLQEQTSPHIAYLGISVAREHRGRGLAQELYQKAERKARGIGIERIYVKAYAENKRAVRFYKRLGFREIALLEDEIKIGGWREDAVLMSKKIVK